MTTEPFIYTGQSNIPRDVTHVLVDPSFKRVGFSLLFHECAKLMNIEPKKGLASMDQSAFMGCTLLDRVSIPSTIKVIGDHAFLGCTHLMYVELSEGLERFDEGAFCKCTSLERIRIPSTVKVIFEYAFYHCTHLIHFELREGLERID
jgi:hypothetical protein